MSRPEGAPGDRGQLLEHAVKHTLCSPAVLEGGKERTVAGVVGIWGWARVRG